MSATSIEWTERTVNPIRARLNGRVKAVFVKQLGAAQRWAGAEATPTAHARGKGNDPSAWPKSLREREFPTTISA